jgi:6-phosphogluconolactonase
MIWVYADLESLSHAAAGIFVQQARQAIQVQGRFSVALSGGHTPQRTYELLAQPPFRDQVAWEHAHIFWGDERCVPPDDARSNERMTRQAWLDHVSIPEAQIHPIRCADSPGQAARQYEGLLREFFEGRSPSFDLIFLGLGEDGHTASLFPETPVLQEQEAWVSEVSVANQDLHRVTLTTPIINQAAVVAFLVAGAAKAGILRAVLEGPSGDPRLPAQLIRLTHGELHWLVDQDASSLVSREA